MSESGTGDIKWWKRVSFQLRSISCIDLATALPWVAEEWLALISQVLGLLLDLLWFL